jgi:hypothetical protein
MALTANQLKKQVDLPTWEWLRFSPVAPSAGLSCSCAADNSQFNENNGRYIYYLLNATNFWRYDTIADAYEQLASPPALPINTGSSMRFAGAQGYFNRVISATSTSFTTGMPSGGLAVGYKVRIVSGKGAGQERIITAVSDPIVADYGGATAGATGALTDTAKAWTTGYVGATLNVNGWVGYVVRTLFGTGANQVRKILYNSATVLTVGDPNFVQNDPFANNTWVAPAAGTVYQIESSVCTVDTAWDDTPDQSSRFVIQSGGIWLISGAAAAPFYTLQYYDVLHDMWYSKPAVTNMIGAVPADLSVERMTENSTIWQQGIATSGSTTTLVDTTQNWAVNAYSAAGYQHEIYIYSGTGRGQVATITSNTSNTLTFPAMAVALDNTSRYQITGYDAGTSSGSNLHNTFNDTTKTWAVNRWANYGVRILFGAGAGQLRRIASNTADALTIVGSWNELPNNTSVYAIQGSTETLFIGWGGSSEVFMHNSGNVDLLSHGRMLDSGIACVAAALLCDSNHMIYEQMPYAISGLAGTTTITATTAQPHNLKVGQWVSIRGVTSGADQYNVTGLEQITTVPSTTTFQYGPDAAGSGAYTYLTALSTANLSDASKDFRELVSSGTNTSITFAKITPSNINGWYATGTNVIPGTTVISGAGTTTLQLSGGAAVPSGVIIFSPWGPSTAVTSTYSSGGGAGVATVTMSAATNANITGWYVVGTGIAIGSTVTSGAGTTAIVLSNACTGAVSGTITFYPPKTAGNQIVMSTAAPVVTSGLTAGQLMQSASSGVGGGTMGFLTAMAVAPVAALTRYMVTSKELLGAALDQTTTTYNSGVATGGSTTTLVDASAFWATATGTGSAQGTTITLSAVSPGHVNGWYVTGTGINLGAKIISGAGTNTITLDIPHSGAVSGIITCAAWNASLIGRRIKVQSGATGLNQELLITAVAPATGTLTFGIAVAPLAGVGVYSLLSIPVKGLGHELSWVSSNTNVNTRGKYLWMPRCGATIGFDRLDLTTDRVVLTYLTPFVEPLGAGSMFAYDGVDRIYFTKDVTQRLYYLDVNTNWVHGAGMCPYNVGTAGIGNKMEIFTTTDGLNYLWINRQQAQEHFRELLFF